MKHIGLIVTVIMAMFGVTLGYGQIQEKAKQTEEKVKRVRNKVDKHDEQIHEFEKYSVRQSVILDNTVKTLEKINKKLDKQ